MAGQWTTKKVDKYVILKEILGQGVYGSVYRGFLQEDETKQVAVKTIKISTISHTVKNLELVKREIVIRQKISHPNIVRLYDVARTKNYLYLFLEYCAEGDLKDYLNWSEQKRLCEVIFSLFQIDAILLVKQIAEGFKLLYKEKIIHLYIQPANILLHQGIAKLTGFGSGRVIDGEMNDPIVNDSLERIFLYTAPQILEGKSFTYKCDIWSLGITFYQALYGNTPWIGENANELLEKIKTQQLLFPKKPVRSEGVKKLISRMLCIEEEERISWETLFEDPIFPIVENLISNDYKPFPKIDKQSRQGYVKELNPQEKKIKLEYNLTKEQIKSNSGETGFLEMEDVTKLLSKLKGHQLVKYYFFFERNLAYFFSSLMIKIRKIQNETQILSEVNYIKLVYVLIQRSMILLKIIQLQLKRKQNDKFDSNIWKDFVLTDEYQNVKEMVDQDLKQLRIFVQDFEFEQKQIQEKMKDMDKQAQIEQVINEFLPFLQKFSEFNDDFKMFYGDIIQQSIKEIKQNNNQSIEVNLLLYYLQISINPSREFNIPFDFDKFYEESNALSLDSIMQKIQANEIALQE